MYIMLSYNSVMRLNDNIDHAWYIKAMHLNGALYTTLPRRYAVDQPHQELFCYSLFSSRTCHIYTLYNTFKDSYIDVGYYN
jgi:hypothetical protein